ncbi:hypothetical protein Naga_102713g1, partial [Nannochloropsis gaditana]
PSLPRPGLHRSAHPEAPRRRRRLQSFPARALHRPAWGGRLLERQTPPRQRHPHPERGDGCHHLRSIPGPDLPEPPPLPASRPFAGTPPGFPSLGLYLSESGPCCLRAARLLLRRGRLRRALGHCGGPGLGKRGGGDGAGPGGGRLCLLHGPGEPGVWERALGGGGRASGAGRRQQNVVEGGEGAGERVGEHRGGGARGLRHLLGFGGQESALRREGGWEGGEEGRREEVRGSCIRGYT